MAGAAKLASHFSQPWAAQVPPGRSRVTITQVVLHHASRYSDFYESLHSKPHAYEVFGLFPSKAGHSAARVCFPDACGQLGAAVISC